MACRTLSIGEQTGGIETMLKQVADYLEKELTTRKGIKGALMYPIIASIVTVIVVGVLMFFVLPAFADLYGSLGAELPALTRIMIDISLILRSYALHIFLGGFIIIGLAMIYFRTADGKFKWDKILLRIPLL